MRLFFFLLFIAVPLTELALLIKVGEIIGVGATILLVIATAVIGVALLKRQGLSALEKARNTVEAGDFPVESVVDGACLLVAGAFLLTPGLITDTLGFALLVPALRRGIARWLFGKLIASGNVHVRTFGGGTPDGEPREGPEPGGRGDGTGPVIEGEAEELENDERERDTRPRERDGSSPWRK